ncbi:4-alpha-glucanotransferase [Roseimaritima ulvae]|uniref:4-alpha-glucanotransferase n=1 Tax=Roseimaritima ulvae TaxID=980254 RepID=A0A5B9QUG0_9BACT|nr:4-alpha-glucanotransferase [Roseimaritima ulvae]QEG42687.1 4-alpha-glucanotransferase [Roseimaritima ulvae]
MHFPRSSGILLPVTSLPGPHGIGDLGASAYAFVEFLQAAGQRIWQILPLGPPAQGNSPYSCISAFAGNPLLISLSQLVDDGLLAAADVAALKLDADDPSNADYEAAAALKEPLLQQAYASFCQAGDSPLRPAYQQFCRQQADWLDDYARYEACLNEFGTADWTRWPNELVQRSPEGLAAWDDRLAERIERAKFLQFVFDQQWTRLKRYANERQIRMYGDMPIFVAHQSADVWAHQDLFSLDEHGRPTLVAGVPPDYFSKTGQRWGNPLYRWDVLEATDYAWWTARFRVALEQFDLLRVDHFRGFESYWEIPAEARTAVEGRWQPGPGAKPFDAARRALGELPIIAEDLGMITEEVHQLREQLGFPGMRVLQFGFDSLDDDFHRPHQYPQHSVAYTGTHDNETIMGWYRKRKPPATGVDPMTHYLGGDQPVHWQLIAAVWESKSDTAIVPMQDLLGLGNEARMNLPGKAKGNWQWRVEASTWTADLAAQLKQLTSKSGR